MFAAHDFVTSGGKVLCEVIGPVVNAFVPAGAKVLAFDAIFDPMTPRVPSFGAFWFHEGGCDTEGS